MLTKKIEKISFVRFTFLFFAGLIYRAPIQKAFYTAIKKEIQ